MLLLGTQEGTGLHFISLPACHVLSAFLSVPYRPSGQTLAPDDRQLSCTSTLFLVILIVMLLTSRRGLYSVFKAISGLWPKLSRQIFLLLPLHQDWEPIARGSTPEWHHLSPWTFPPLAWSIDWIFVIYWIYHFLHVQHLNPLLTLGSSPTACALLYGRWTWVLQPIKEYSTQLRPARPFHRGVPIIVVLAALPWLVLADFPVCNCFLWIVWATC